MDNSLIHIWAKTSKDTDDCWHPLILHMLDVAASAGAIMNREPESTRERLAEVLGMPWAEAFPWLLLLIACHDLGKACPGFQCKWNNLSGMDSGRSPNTDINHAFVSQIELAGLLTALGWREDLAELAADAVGCHHGERAAPTTIVRLMGDTRALGKSEWTEARRALFQLLLVVFAPGKPPVKEKMTGPDFMLLSGLTSFSDWVGSNETWFPFGSQKDCEDLNTWFQTRRSKNAEQALNAIGWDARIPLASEPRRFEDVFDFSPRPLQQALANALADVQEPSLLLVEAPMGEGKTEAAFYAHLELQRRFGHRGLYVALPTKATGNAMFMRTLKFLRSQNCSRQIDLQLLHGGALLNDDYQKLKPSGIYDTQAGGDVRAGEWFTHKKRALLSEYGVGTVDQALLTILPVRHQFVRLWGLANRVVVFDEIHAYDAYTGMLLIHLLRWLLALGSSVLLLSATLPPTVRRKLAALTNTDYPEQEANYPRLSVYSTGQPVQQIAFAADPARRITLHIQPIASDLDAMQATLDSRLSEGGFALALANTVQRAQDLYRRYPDGEAVVIEGQPVGKRLADGTEIYLFHARFPANQRQRREDAALQTFGPAGQRTGRKILIATQVAEQSLDLDFDLIATDLAPIDLLLQRAGRLWRHARASRPVAMPTLIVSGLAEELPPSFGRPLWWGAVYREDILLRTWCLLRGKNRFSLPEEIDGLVKTVYEEEVEVPECLQDRLQKSLIDGEGKAISHMGQANKAIIGFPDDASWNDPARRSLYDEDEPGVHRTLMAQTRLGDDSVIVIPLWPADRFDTAVTPDFQQSKVWFMRAMSLARKGIVTKLKAAGIPEGWKKNPLLRNAYPMMLNEINQWVDDTSAQLDAELGLIYESKETE